MLSIPSRIIKIFFPCPSFCSNCLSIPSRIIKVSRERGCGLYLYPFNSIKDYQEVDKTTSVKGVNNFQFHQGLSEEELDIIASLNLKLSIPSRIILVSIRIKAICFLNSLFQFHQGLSSS